MTDMSGQVHSHCTGFAQGNQLPSETETAEWLEIKKVWKQQLQLGTEKIKCPELREGILHEHNEMPPSTRGCFQWAGMETIPGAHVIRIHLNMKWISENSIWHSTVPMLISECDKCIEVMQKKTLVLQKRTAKSLLSPSFSPPPPPLSLSLLTFFHFKYINRRDIFSLSLEMRKTVTVGSLPKVIEHSLES